MAKIWTGKSQDGLTLKEGTFVEVVDIEGVKLVVVEKKGGDCIMGWVFAIIFIIVLAAIVSNIRVVPQATAFVIERLGAYKPHGCRTTCKSTFYRKGSL